MNRVNRVKTTPTQDEVDRDLIDGTTLTDRPGWSTIRIEGHRHGTKLNRMIERSASESTDVLTGIGTTF